jgi:acetolactate synthase I/II/III large subunit
MKRKVLVADKVVEFVGKFCSRKIFVLTGNGAMYLNDAIERSGQLDYICVRNEAVGPMAAAAAAQLTGVPGVVCVTAGPGSTNALPGVAEAWVDSAPVLILSGQVPSGEIDNYGRTSFENRSFGIAGIPIASYAEEFTKASISLRSADALKETLFELYVCLISGRKGPVWLDIPLNIQASEIDDFDLSELEAAALKQKNQSEIGLEALDWVNINKLLKSSSRPLIIFGRGIESVSDRDQLSEKLTSLRIPFALSRVVAYMFPLTMPGNLGVLGVRGRPWSKEVLKKCDLIISFGCRLPSSLVGPNYAYLEPNCKIVLVDWDESEIRRHGDRLTLGIKKSISELEQSITSLVPAQKSGYEDWFEYCTKLKERSGNSHLTQEPHQRFNLYWFMKNLEKHATSSTILTTDAGSNYYASGQSVNFENFRQEITSGTFAAMGLSLPLAIGAASEILTEEGLVFCVTGDGSIELNIQELQTLSIYQLPIKIFVINNGGYASMRTWQDTFFEGRYIGSTDDTGTKPLDFRKIAYAFDISYETIENPSEFDRKMSTITSTRNPQLIEVLCDSNQRLMLPMETDLV